MKGRREYLICKHLDVRCRTLSKSKKHRASYPKFVEGIYPEKAKMDSRLHMAGMIAMGMASRYSGILIHSTPLRTRSTKDLAPS